MKPGQTTVLGLLILLLALEAVRNKNVLIFLKTWLANFRQGINATTAPAATSGKSATPKSTVLPRPGSPGGMIPL